MKIKDSHTIRISDEQLGKYITSHFNFTRRSSSTRKNDILSSIENFYTYNMFTQKVLVCYSWIMHLFDRSFMTIGKKKDAYILLKYNALLDDLYDNDDEGKKVRTHLSKGLKTCFTDMRYGSVYYEDDSIYVKDRLLSEILASYEACQTPSVSTNIFVKFFHFAINKIEQGYYHMRYPMNACLMLKNHYTFLEQVMGEEEIAMDETFFRDFLLSYSTICDALLPSYTSFSRSFFKALYSKISQLSPEDYPSHDDITDEEMPLLNSNNASTNSYCFFSTSVETSAENVHPHHRDKTIETIKAQFNEELRALHCSVLKLHKGTLEGSNINKGEQLKITKAIKKMFLQYHPDKHDTEEEALLQIYTQSFQRIGQYYNSISAYFKTRNSADLPNLDEILGVEPKTIDMTAMEQEINHLWRQFLNDLERLKRDFGEMRKEQEAREEQLKEIKGLHEEVVSRLTPDQLHLYQQNIGKLQKKQ